MEPNQDDNDPEDFTGITSNAIRSRSKNGLGPLTFRLFKHLKENEEVKVADLAKELEVPARRVYDVNNVLEVLCVTEKFTNKRIRLSKKVKSNCNVMEKERLMSTILKMRSEKVRYKAVLVNERTRSAQALATGSGVTEAELSSIPRFDGASIAILVSPQDSEMRVINREGVKTEFVLDLHLKSREGQIDFKVIKVKKGVEDDPFRDIECRRPEPLLNTL